jgi:hypothetical protein
MLSSNNKVSRAQQIVTGVCAAIGAVAAVVLLTKFNFFMPVLG